jgi:hypothetical protein
VDLLANFAHLYRNMAAIWVLSEALGVVWQGSK